MKKQIIKMYYLKRLCWKNLDFTLFATYSSAVFSFYSLTFEVALQIDFNYGSPQIAIDYLQIILSGLAVFYVANMS